MNDKRKEYLKKWREDNKEHIRHYKKEYAKTHDSSFKKLQDKYKQLQQEKEELKKQLEEFDRKLFFTKNELDMRQKSIDDKLTQQKEFIKYLEDEKDRLARECSNIYEDSLGHTRLVNEDIFDEVNDILQKYKSIIGENDV